MKPKAVILVILAIIIFIFMVQNTHVIDVKFFFWKLSMSRIILIALILLIGFIAGFVVAEKGGKRK